MLLACGKQEQVSAPQQVENEAVAAPQSTEEPEETAESAWLSHTKMLSDISDRSITAVLEELHGESQNAEGMPDVLFYRQIPFGEGWLVLAGVDAGEETTPDLYYVVNGVVQARTSGADHWAINIARLQGQTIVFGASFAYQADITHIVAEFFNGAEELQRMQGTAADGGEGFILVTEGAQALKSLSIYQGETLVTNQEDYLFSLGCANYAWAGMVYNIFYVTHLNEFAESEASDVPSAIAMDQLNAGPFRWDLVRYEKTADWTEGDAWRNNNALTCGVNVESGQTLHFTNVPDNLQRVYLVYPELDDATEAGAAKAVTPLKIVDGSVTMPDLAGHTEVRLIFETDTTADAMTMSVD